MNEQAAQALLAGWLSGAAAGLATTALVLVAATRRPGLISELPLLQGHPGVLGIVVANATVIALTLVGLVLGAAYYASDAQPGRFALLVGVGVVVLGGLYAYVRGRVWSDEAPLVLVALAIVGLAFAVMLPQLAAR